MAEPELEEIDLNEFSDPQLGITAEPSFGSRRRPRKPFAKAPMSEEDKSFFRELEIVHGNKTPTIADRIISQNVPELVKGSRERIKHAETIAATLNISFSEAYDGEKYYSKEMQARAPDLFKESGTSFMRGIGSAYVNFGQGMGYLGAPEFAQTYIDYGKSIQKAYMPKLKPPEVAWSNFINPEWYATTAAENLPTTLSLIPAGIIGAYGAVMAGAPLALGAFGKTVLGALGATALTRPIESAMEAAQTKQEALAKGMPETEAQKAGDKVFYNNLAFGGGFDIAQIAAAFTPLKVLGSHAPKALAARILATSAKVAGGAALEGGEEAIQSAFQQSALEGIGIFDALKRFNPEMKESTMVGSIFGVGLPVAGSVFNALSERVTNVMPPKLAEAYQVAEQTAVARGADPIAAKVEALDALAETPEGKAHIEKVMTELKDIAEGNPVEPITGDEMQTDIDKFGGEEVVIGDIDEGVDIASDEILESILKEETSIEAMLGLDTEAPAETEFFVSEETYHAAQASLKEKLSGLHAGIDPTALADLVKIGAYHLERGVRNFAEWSKLMLDRFGQAVKPHLQNIWEQSNGLIERKIPSGVDLGEDELAKTKEIEAEDKTLPAKQVKPSVRRITGQQSLAKLIREDDALRAAMKKAEQASRIAYREGSKEAKAQAKAELRDILIKAKVKAEMFGFREGFKTAEKLTRKELVEAFNDEQQAIDETRKALVQIIQEELPPEMRGKYLDAIISKLTDSKQNNLLDRIAAMKDKLTKEELIDELASLQRMRGNIDVEYQKRIDALIGDINTKNISAATRERIESLMAFAEENEMPSGVSRKTLELIKRLEGRQASEMSIEDLKQLTEAATHLTEMGKFKRKLKYQHNERERKKALDKLLSTTHSLDIAALQKDTPVAKMKAGALDIYVKGLNSVRVAEMIDGWGDGENGKLVRQLLHAELAAVWDIRTTIDAAINEAVEAGISELTEDQEGRIMVNIRNREGAEKATLNLMEKYGYQEIPVLSPAEEKLVAILKKYSSDMFGDQIAAAFEEITNQPFPKLEGRILPLKYEGEPKKSPEEIIMHTPHKITQTERGFTVERQSGVEKMPRTDIWGIFEEGINEQLWFLHMQPALNNVKNLVKTKEYVNKAGELASNWWRDHLDIVGRRGWSATATHGPFQQALKAARNNMNQAILGYRLSTMFVQPFAVFEAMGHAQAKYGTNAARRVFAEFAKSWVVPGYARAYVDNDITHALATREAGEVAIQEAMYKVGRHGQMQSGLQGGLKAAFIRNGLEGIKKADLRTAAGVQQAMEKILLDEGASADEAKREAAVMMDMSQSSSDVSMRPHVLAFGEGYRTWLTFQTFALNQWGLIAHDLVTKGVVKGGGAGRMSAIAGLGMIVASMIAMNDAREYLWEIIHRRALKGRSVLQDAMFAIPSSVPVFGGMFSVASGRRSAEVPMVKVVGDLLRALMIPTMDKPESQARAALRAAEAGAILFGGVPGTSQGFDFLEGMLFPEQENNKRKMPARAKQ